MLSKYDIESYMFTAYDSARDSPDLSSQNGAVLVKEGDEVTNLASIGVNHFYQGFSSDQTDRGTKLRNIEHAERDAIYGCPVPTQGLIMVCPWAACIGCARAIKGAGITNLIVHKERMDLTPDRWKNDVDDALLSLKRGKVNVQYYSGSIDVDPIRVSGRLWSPKYLEFLE